MTLVLQTARPRSQSKAEGRAGLKPQSMAMPDQQLPKKQSHKVDDSHKHVVGHFIYPLIPL